MASAEQRSSDLHLEGNVLVIDVSSEGLHSLNVEVNSSCSFPVISGFSAGSRLVPRLQIGDVLLGLNEHSLLGASRLHTRYLFLMCQFRQKRLVLLRKKNCNEGNEKNDVSGSDDANAAILPNNNNKQVIYDITGEDKDEIKQQRQQKRQTEFHSNQSITLNKQGNNGNDQPQPQKCSSHAPTIAGKISSTVFPRSLVLNSATLKKSMGRHGGSLIELLDSSDSEDEDKTGNGNGNQNQIHNENLSATAPDLVFGKADIFPSQNANFPPTIDTNFNGNEAIQKVPRDGNLIEIDSLMQFTTAERQLPLIWPQNTPTPSVGGGFYEVLGACSKHTTPKRRKTISSSRKTYSRVARLAGTITLRISISNKEISNLCLNKHSLEATFVLAESLRSYANQCLDSKGKDALKVIAALNDKDNPFRERCLYVIAEKPNIPPVRNNDDDLIGKMAELKFYVYLRRALFGLSANSNIKILMGLLEPLPNSEPWVACRDIPASTNQYERSKRPQATSQGRTSHFDHSLPGILWANESTGYPIPSPLEAKNKSYQGVTVTLRDYQHESVAWMKNQENLNIIETGGGVAGLNGYFWEKRFFMDGDAYYYFPLSGQLLSCPPPVVTGGLLAEEMGLGKTVITLELVCSDISQKPKAHGGTLVVVPVSLLTQWEDEVKSKAPHLTTLIYHGVHVQPMHDLSRDEAIVEISKYDIILTTFSKLLELAANRAVTSGRAKNYLDKIHWHRMVVDECQFLKNDTTVIASAAATVKATHVWMLSGTPLTNKLDDLRGELSLLRVWPFTLGTTRDKGWQDHFWSGFIKNGWDSHSGDSLAIIHQLMRSVCMRHSRLQIRNDNGTPLVDLPPRREKFVAVTMDSSSSYAFIYRWVEALAVLYTQLMGRYDVRVWSLVGKLRQLVSAPVLDHASLNHIDNVLSHMKDIELEKADNECKIKKVYIQDAVREGKEQDSAILPELMQLMRRGVASLSPCTYCRKPRTRPAYFSCLHSLCVRCCQILLQENEKFPCPACNAETHLCDIIEVVTPEAILTTRTRREEQKQQQRNVIEIDMDTGEVDDSIPDQNYKMSPYHTYFESISLDQLSIRTSTYRVVQQEHPFERLQQEDKNAANVTLKKHPEPTANNKDCNDDYIMAVSSNLENATKMQSLIKHSFACSRSFCPSPKIKALCEILHSIRDTSVTSKICIFSTYKSVLDEVEKVLDNFQYTIEYDMNTAHTCLLIGQRVQLLDSSRPTIKLNEFGRVVGRVTQSSNRNKKKSSPENYVYEIELPNGEVVHRQRKFLFVEPLVVENVPTKMVRNENPDDGQSADEFCARFKIGSKVASKRPVVPSTKLCVGFNVEILPDDKSSGEIETGCVVAVNHIKNDEGHDKITFDVLPDGYRPVSEITEEGEEKVKEGEVERKPTLYNVEPSRLRDQGGAERWLPGMIKGVATRQRLDQDIYTKSDDRCDDPFKYAFGYVRLDGSSGDADRRGEILNKFKSDPQTSICLLTKQSAGVGLNLIDANVVIILEPSLNAHDEVQSICRVHRIGQSRQVQVLKLYMTDSVEERILKRRDLRGELNVSENAAASVATEDEEITHNKVNNSSKNNRDRKNVNDTEVLSSRAVTYNDLKLLVGGDHYDDNIVID